MLKAIIFSMSLCFSVVASESKININCKFNHYKFSFETDGKLTARSHTERVGEFEINVSTYGKGIFYLGFVKVPATTQDGINKLVSQGSSFGASKMAYLNTDLGTLSCAVAK